ILFNHESPIRGETFVTRKITRAVARIAMGLQSGLYLGNLSALRDWGHARDFVKAQWLILQQDRPDDFVIATGEQHSVREFCGHAFRKIGLIMEWRGKGIEETGIVAGLCASDLLARHNVHCISSSALLGRPVVFVDPGYFRPTEVETLLGDPTKAREKLGWRPEVSFDELVEEMIVSDLDEAAREAVCKRNGFATPASCEAGL